MDNFYNECPAKMADARFLTDYRSSNTREQYIRSINNVVNSDESRIFLSENAEKIMDAEWQYLNIANSCKATTCVHTVPLRAPMGSSHKELQMYNAVQTGKITKNDENYPVCKPYADYRLTETPGAKY
jgi:hypothetical protein